MLILYILSYLKSKRKYCVGSINHFSIILLLLVQNLKSLQNWIQKCHLSFVFYSLHYKLRHLGAGLKFSREQGKNGVYLVILIGQDCCHRKDHGYWLRILEDGNGLCILRSGRRSIHFRGNYSTFRKIKRIL